MVEMFMEGLTSGRDGLGPLMNGVRHGLFMQYKHDPCELLSDLLEWIELWLPLEHVVRHRIWNFQAPNCERVLTIKRRARFGLHLGHLGQG